MRVYCVSVRLVICAVCSIYRYQSLTQPYGSVETLISGFSKKINKKHVHEKRDSSHCFFPIKVISFISHIRARRCIHVFPTLNIRRLSPILFLFSLYTKRLSRSREEITLSKLIKGPTTRVIRNRNACDSYLSDDSEES